MHKIKTHRYTQINELCLSKSYFLYENKIRLENAGPIGFSLIVELSESFLHTSGMKDMTEALTIQIKPKTFKRYVDDSHAGFTSKHNANISQELVNKQGPAIQYTTEYENEKKSLNFLDINITSTINKKDEFKVHHKKAINNIHIKLILCIDSNIIKNVFKGFLHIAHSLCSGKYIKEEKKKLINMFVENGHDKQLLKNLVIKYNNKKNNKNNQENNIKNQDYKYLKKLHWIPNISSKIKRQFNKIWRDIVFTSGKNLQQIVC